MDVRNNRESRAASANASGGVARASDGGAPPREALAAGESPEPRTEGTAGGNPVAGLEISAESREDAVAGDQEAIDLEGPTTKHA